MIDPPILVRCACALLAACLLAGATSARQIRLPPRALSRGDITPYVACSVCGERNYSAPTQARRDENGDPIAWCMHCRRDTLHRGQRSASSGSSGRLRLPPPRPEQAPAAIPATDGPDKAPIPQGEASAREPTRGEGAGASGAPEASDGPEVSDGTERALAGAADTDRRPGAGAAEFIFAQVRKTTNVDDRLALQAVDSLAALGAAGLAAARLELEAEEAPVLVTAARLLLRSGSGDDIELVKSRARRKLPAAAGGALVEALAAADPVRVTPRTFAELLESNHSGVRLAAEKALRSHLGPELLPLLEPALAAKRGDTRLAALGLVADISDPPDSLDSPDSNGAARVTSILLEHIDDPLARVASRAVSALGSREDPELDARLVALAFRQRWILRESAYALLAIIEREDLGVRPILDASAVEPLLFGMESSDPFVGGTCAAALAGVGFRSSQTKSTGWLDRDVVDRLVHAISGQTFHNDYSALAVPALRRLRLVTGQELGNDGPRWIEWWLAARPTFYARRACLEVAPEDLGRVRLHFAVRGEADDGFTLLGPDAGSAAPERQGLAGETIYLTAAQARDLLIACEREGVLGAERLPGRRGSPTARTSRASGTAYDDGERLLDIAIAERGKSFVFAPGASEPWFERTVAAALALRDKNRWQRFPRPDAHESSYALWLVESEWWSQERSDRERALRLKALVLGALPYAVGTARDRGVAELERLAADASLYEPADFTVLLGLIQSETTYSERVRKLHRLALLAAGGGEAGAPDRDPAVPIHPVAPIPRELGLALGLALIERFGAAATEDLARTVEACGSEVARQLAGDPHPELRAVTARTLAADPTEANVAALMKLLQDPVQKVEVAAVEALGAHALEAARTELLVRARLGLPAVRIAALQAIGELGGEYALDALMLGISDADPAIHVAAARGLAALADPASAPLLITLLAEGPNGHRPAVYAAARAGLLHIGEAARPELLRAVHTPAHRARREVALLLAEQCVPEATSALITLLTTSPDDAYIASELAVLTGLDMRNEPDPAGAWWNWWDGVVHDDALAWFRAALERAGLETPARSAFEGAGTAEGRTFLVEVLARPEPHLVERSRRELSRMLGRDLGVIPPKGAARDAWLADLRGHLDALGEQ